jgi:hypothetical protein
VYGACRLSCDVSYSAAAGNISAACTVDYRDGSYREGFGQVRHVMADMGRVLSDDQFAGTTHRLTSHVTSSLCDAPTVTGRGVGI